jgi:hypothetical protein
MIQVQFVFRPAFRKYEIAATNCTLSPGDVIRPDTVIGRNPATGELMKAGVRGRVKTMYFNSSNKLMIITIECNLYQEILHGRSIPST